MRQETKRAKPVVKSNQHHTLIGQICAIILRIRALTEAISTAVYPYHYRQFVTGHLRRCPDIQVQAVFTGWCGIGRKIGAVISHWRWTKLCTVFNPLPRSCRLRRFPAQVTYWWRGKGNAFITVDIPNGCPRYLSCIAFDRVFKCE